MSRKNFNNFDIIDEVFDMEFTRTNFMFRFLKVIDEILEDGYKDKERATIHTIEKAYRDFLDNLQDLKDCKIGF